MKNEGNKLLGAAIEVDTTLGQTYRGDLFCYQASGPCSLVLRQPMRDGSTSYKWIQSSAITEVRALGASKDVAEASVGRSSAGSSWEDRSVGPERSEKGGGHHGGGHHSGGKGEGGRGGKSERRDRSDEPGSSDQSVNEAFEPQAVQSPITKGPSKQRAEPRHRYHKTETDKVLQAAGAQLELLQEADVGQAFEPQAVKKPITKGPSKQRADPRHRYHKTETDKMLEAAGAQLQLLQEADVGQGKSGASIA